MLLLWFKIHFSFSVGVDVVIWNNLFRLKRVGHFNLNLEQTLWHLQPTFPPTSSLSEQACSDFCILPSSANCLTVQSVLHRGLEKQQYLGWTVELIEPVPLNPLDPHSCAQRGTWETLKPGITAPPVLFVLMPPRGKTMFTNYMLLNPLSPFFPHYLFDNVYFLFVAAVKKLCVFM